MTPQEIKELVSKKIAGQGSQVDIGGALAEILNGIVDAIPQPKSFTLPAFGNFNEKTAAEVVALNIGFSSEAEVKDFYEKAINREYDFINVEFAGGAVTAKLIYGGSYSDNNYHNRFCGYIQSTSSGDGINYALYLGVSNSSLFSATVFEL